MTDLIEVARSKPVFDTLFSLLSGRNASFPVLDSIVQCQKREGGRLLAHALFQPLKPHDFRVFCPKSGYFGQQCYSEGNGFAQFSGKVGWPRVDLMIVDDATFGKLSADSPDSVSPRTPSARHMIALKLHAACSPDRSKPEQDWEDIRQLVILYQLDPSNTDIHDLILRYGGNQALARIQEMWKNFSKKREDNETRR